jgi:hypothetical protein
MNKILILISILLGTVLIITNFAASNGLVHIIIWWSNPWMLALVWIIIWFIAGFWTKGFLSEKWWNDYNNDEWVNF